MLYQLEDKAKQLVYEKQNEMTKEDLLKISIVLNQNFHRLNQLKYEQKKH